MKPPSVYEVTRPSAHKINSTTAMVYSMEVSLALVQPGDRRRAAVGTAARYICSLKPFSKSA